MKAQSLATTIEEMERLLQKLFTKRSFDEGLEFQPRPTDVIISPFPKCGTTWLQQIAHGLRTRGSMAFEEITVATPWIEVALDMGWDLEAPHVAEPRVYKSHLTWHDVPKGGRYVCAFRHPVDTMVSFFRFFEGFFFQPGSISMTEFLRWRIERDSASGRSYWHHLVSWWQQRDNPDVLLLTYEGMREDLPRSVEAVAHHMGIDLDEDLRDIVLRQSSRDFMLAHSEHFDEGPVKRRAERLGILPASIDAMKVTAGQAPDVGGGMPQDLIDELDAQWNQHVRADTGLDNYGELRRLLVT